MDVVLINKSMISNSTGEATNAEAFDDSAAVVF
jgi:hypothetical protein